MDRLPVEILLHVFSFIPKKELMTTIPQVCRRWDDVATDPSLYRTLELVDEDLDTETAIRFLSAATWLTSLKLTGRTDADVLMQHIGVNHPRLLKLVIHKCRGSLSKDAVSAIELLQLVRRCTTLQQFSLLKTRCDSKVLITEIWVNLRDLRVIAISGSLWFDSEALVSITNQYNIIERIRLQCVNCYKDISSIAVAKFCDKFHESLTSCVLHTGWTNASLASLSRCQNVKKLSLAYSRGINDEEIMLLCQLPKLESLTISDFNNISSSGWVRLFRNSSMKSLVKLSLLIIIDDLVISAISLLPNLTDLYFRGDEITDEGLLSLSNVSNLSRLRMFDDANITSRGWIRFFETSNVKQNMMHLKLSECENINDEVKETISRNLTKLQELDLSY